MVLDLADDNEKSSMFCVYVGSRFVSEELGEGVLSSTGIQLRTRTVPTNRCLFRVCGQGKHELGYTLHSPSNKPHPSRTRSTMLQHVYKRTCKDIDFLVEY